MMKKNKYCVAGAAVVIALLVGLTGCGRSQAELLIAEEEVTEGQPVYREDGKTTDVVSADEATVPDGTTAEKTSTAAEGVASPDGTTVGNTPADTANSGRGEQICVYICGEVCVPGVYMLPEGARICDAVEAAGGLTQEASRDYWNLAERLVDGAMISVPTEAEAKERLGAGAGQGASEMTGQKTLSDGADIAASSDDSRVNLNTATAEELMTIPGIGEAKAKAIVSYRQENGDFSSIEEIMNISGIKEGLFRQMKDYIMVN